MTGAAVKIHWRDTEDGMKAEVAKAEMVMNDMLRDMGIPVTVRFERLDLGRAIGVGVYAQETKSTQ